MNKKTHFLRAGVGRDAHPLKGVARPFRPVNSSAHSRAQNAIRTKRWCESSENKKARQKRAQEVAGDLLNKEEQK
ncbi:hypothetical protein [Escherichia coli]|uniref:hypothetical protein n=1 Tax=Escherichia coli TaxID=562 RepID=UPI00135E8A38|nr:hypothetical protein [Escherichia coli]MXF04504.1 hypothetical protein [Escherichia coli]